VTGFDALFGGVPAVTAAAPGRVNLIGEHTDYNDGFVLPIALRRRTQVELAPRAGRRVRVWSEAAGGAGVVAYELGEEHRRHDWVDYIQGVTDALARDGQAIGGFDARVESSVPVGRGLASSAALEIALLRALREAFGLGLDELAMARLGRAAENDFVGAPVGIMDQMAAALGDAGHALFIDTRTLAWERLPQPATVELVVVDSGISHRHASGEYRVRRDECGRAAARLGVAALRDLAPEDLPRAAALGEPLARRVRHVVTENARVLAMVDALRAADAERCGALLAASHASLRDDFEVSLPPIDRLVAAALAHPAVYGARITGGGFGGAVIALARPGEGAAAARAIVARASELSAAVLLPAAA